MKMLQFLAPVYSRKKLNRRGVLTFEWILIFAITVVGIIGGLAAVRDATVVQLGSTAGALGALDSSFEIPKFTESITYTDTAGAPQTMNITVPEMKYTAKKLTVTPAAGNAPTSVKFP
ncbi:MAG: hypothetical protein Q4C96_10430 [Planctomycetia bacterium]|nr:hypothetical protein [Planctomycetia bacterium]